MEKFHINKSFIVFISWSFFTIVIGLIAALAAVFLYLSPNLPSIALLKELELQTPLRIYSIDNKLIGEFGEKRRDPVSIDETPQLLLDAVLAAEDDAFYEHAGVDIKGLLRAASQLILSGEIQSGGSTITMQVARNFFLSREQTFSRKFNEILLAIKIEQSLSKRDILELYLNKIYLGNRAYGVKAAAQVYYGKNLSDLSLAQIAMIAGLPKAPSTYNPIANPERALLRRNWILKRMYSLGKISQGSFDTAVEEQVTARYYGQNLELNAPYIAEAAREEAIALYGDKAYTNGYKIYTTVDSKLQSAAQQAVVKGLLNYDNRHGYRGPEQQLDFSILEPLASDQANVQTESMNDNTAEPLGAVNFIPWLDILKQIPRHNILEPAAVVSIREKSISALMATGETVDVPWENGISKALPFVNENFAGPQPQSPADVVKLGDVIRIYKDEDKGWYFSQSPNIEAALVAINPEDGAIRSMVGGFDFSKSSFNRASQAKRQPGSNFKPFIYTVGIEQGLTPATIFNDAPIVVDDARLESSWRPENASGKFYGPTRMRKALFLSRNLVSIRLLRSLGIASTVSAMERFGMDIQSIPRDLSMALGSHIMSPIEIATGYSTFANGGFKIEPYLVHHIRDRHDNVLRSAKPKVVPGSQATLFKVDASTEGKADTDSLEDTVADTDSTVFTLSTRSLTDKLAENLNQQHNQGEKLVVELDSQIAERVIDERISYIINSMLKDVIKRGTGKRAQALGRNDLAGKTGTTNGPIDAWFSGYNRKMVTTTWVGFDNNQKLGRGEYGGVAALPIWIDYMQAALDNVPETNFPQPDGIVTVRINPETGERALPSDPNGIFELFLEENAPRERPVGQTPGNSSDNPAPEDLF